MSVPVPTSVAPTKSPTTKVSSSELASASTTRSVDAPPRRRKYDAGAGEASASAASGSEPASTGVMATHVEASPSPARTPHRSAGGAGQELSGKLQNDDELDGDGRQVPGMPA